MKILVIEENLSRRKIIHRKIQLTKINSTIVLVKNIRQALNYLKYSSIDLILINKQLFNLLTEAAEAITIADVKSIFCTEATIFATSLDLVIILFYTLHLCSPY